MPIRQVVSKAAPTGVNKAESSTPAQKSKEIKPRISIENGQITAAINGKKLQIKDPNIHSTMSQAWVLGGGRFVAFSGTDGAGGFENEGQSLRLHDTKTGKTTKVMAETAMITDVREVKTPSGKAALLVGMQDGGLGGDHFALVDPSRGQTFRMPMAKVLEVKADRITFGTFKEEDYSMSDGNAKPSGKKSFSLSQLLSRPVIVNTPPSWE